MNDFLNFLLDDKDDIFFLTKEEEIDLLSTLRNIDENDKADRIDF